MTDYCAQALVKMYPGFEHYHQIGFQFNEEANLEIKPTSEDNLRIRLVCEKKVCRAICMKSTLRTLAIHIACLLTRHCACTEWVTVVVVCVCQSVCHSTYFQPLKRASIQSR